MNFNTPVCVYQNNWSITKNVFMSILPARTRRNVSLHMEMSQDTQDAEVPLYCTRMKS